MSLSKELRLVMEALVIVLVIVVILLLIGAAMSVRVVKQYEQGVLFRLGKVLGARPPGLRIIIPFIDVLHRVSLRIVTMPIQSQGIITQDNVSVDVSAVAYFRVVDAVKSVVAIENVYSAIDQIAQTTLRKVVGQHSLDQTLSETDKINLDIRKILDVSTVEWGVEVTLVELKDIQLPDTMKRAMAKQAEAEREKRAKIINAEGESLAAAALGDASDIMMAHPLALQLRNLQSLVEIGVDKNTTVVFPAPLMTTIAELGSFLAGEKAAAGLPAAPPVAIPPALIPAGNGTPVNGAPANGPALTGPPAGLNSPRARAGRGRPAGHDSKQPRRSRCQPRKTPAVRG
jgi:regulator of protease activity HflC (stomatin/prohibitin superfamily)